MTPGTEYRWSPECKKQMDTQKSYIIDKLLKNHTKQKFRVNKDVDVDPINRIKDAFSSMDEICMPLQKNKGDNQQGGVYCS